MRTFKTKKIRPISTTRSGGKVISPTESLRKLKDGQFLIVDDHRSRTLMINAAHRLDISVKTRKCKKGYEVHRLAKHPPKPLEDYPI